MENYIYKAKIESIYDGDTMTCTIDCGFGVYLSKQKIRLFGIDTPEVRGDEKKDGIRIRDIVRKKLLGKEITLKTIKDKKGKYGRYLGIIYLNENNDYININEWLVENNYAEKKIY